MDAALPLGAAAPAAAPATTRPRIDSVDLLRGLVMVIMVLDHTRDFFHRDAFLYAPEDLARSTPALFLTRWITHFCAPVFVLLAGTGAMLQRQRGTPRGELSRYLLTRGAWLVVLEFTLVRLGFEFNLDYAASFGVFQVIWVIGVSMMVLAGLVHLPTTVVGALGVAMIALHNLLDRYTLPAEAAVDPSAIQQLWFLAHQPGPVSVFGFPAFALYPLVPWIGVMAAGYALGTIYTWEPGRRQRFLVGLGLALTAGFLILRATNLYGDPVPWAAQTRGPGFTALSFLNTNKYPPSLLFLMMTLGPSLVALAWFERVRRDAAGQALVTLGRVPLFFYLMQWYIPHVLAVLAGLAAGQSVAWQFEGITGRFALTPGSVGFGLPVVYAAWFTSLALLYPLCVRYAALRRKHPNSLLRFL